MTAALSALAVFAGPAVLIALPSPEPDTGPVEYAATLSVTSDVAVPEGAEASLAVYSVTVIDCEPERSIVDDLRGILGSVAATLIGDEAAEAGHASDFDAAAVVGPWRLGSSESTSLGVALLDQAAYCEAHITFAWRKADETVNSGSTVSLTRADGASVSTDTSWGMILPLTYANGAPITVAPGEPVVVSFDLVLDSDVFDEGSATIDPDDLLRSIVANSSVTAST